MTDKYPNGWFKIDLFPFGTTVVLNGPQLISELCNAPDDAFSLAKFAEKVCAASCHSSLVHILQLPNGSNLTLNGYI